MPSSAFPLLLLLLSAVAAQRGYGRIFHFPGFPALVCGSYYHHFTGGPHEVRVRLPRVMEENCRVRVADNPAGQVLRELAVDSGLAAPAVSEDDGGGLVYTLDWPPFECLDRTNLSEYVFDFVAVEMATGERSLCNFLHPAERYVQLLAEREARADELVEPPAALRAELPQPPVDRSTQPLATAATDSLQTSQPGDAPTRNAEVTEEPMALRLEMLHVGTEAAASGNHEREFSVPRPHNGALVLAVRGLPAAVCRPLEEPPLQPGDADFFEPAFWALGLSEVPLACQFRLDWHSWLLGVSTAVLLDRLAEKVAVTFPDGRGSYDDWTWTSVQFPAVTACHLPEEPTVNTGGADFVVVGPSGRWARCLFEF